jgi:hypothetical protein
LSKSPEFKLLGRRVRHPAKDGPSTASRRAIASSASRPTRRQTEEGTAVLLTAGRIVKNSIPAANAKLEEILRLREILSSDSLLAPADARTAQAESLDQQLAWHILS